MEKNSESTASKESPKQPLDVSWVKRAFLVTDTESGGPTKNFSKLITCTNESDAKYDDIFHRKESGLGEYLRIFRSPKLLEHAVSFVLGNSSQIIHMAEELQTREEQNLRAAALENWFVQPETPRSFLFELSKKIENNENIEPLFCEMVEENILPIFLRLQEAFPPRREILQEALALHNERRYLASIPLILTSAEGIASSVSRKSIFTSKGWSKGGSAPEIAPWIDKQQMSRLARIYLSVLQVEYPFSKGGKNGTLSRHRVLHGNVIDYGHKHFSLQAISILGFVGWAFSSDGLIDLGR